MATQDGKMHGTAAPPFATKDGLPQAQGTGGGGHDFVKEPTSPGSGTAGGFDPTKMSRPQSEAKPEVVPNPQEIPSGNGGRILQADPGPVSATVSGTASGPQPRSPMKLHNPPFSVSGHGGKAGTVGGPGQSGAPDSASSASSAYSASKPFSSSSSASKR
jgi:hypothetical protein